MLDALSCVMLSSDSDCDSPEPKRAKMAEPPADLGDVDTKTQNLKPKQGKRESIRDRTRMFNTECVHALLSTSIMPVPLHAGEALESRQGPY